MRQGAASVRASSRQLAPRPRTDVKVMSSVPLTKVVRSDSCERAPRERIRGGCARGGVSMCRPMAQQARTCACAHLDSIDQSGEG